MWRETELVFVNDAEVLFLGAAAESPPSSPKSRRAGARQQPGSAQVPVLARAQQQLQRTSTSSPAYPLYFEVYIKTSGGGLQPSGAIGVGLAALPAADCAVADDRCSESLEASPATISSRSADDETTGGPTTHFLHYHSAGRRFAVFPRASPRAGRAYGQTYGTGDTIGCGWLANGDVFFTFNGRHLGVAHTDVWGTLCPAVDFDSPGACLELTLGGAGERQLRYVGDGAARGAERLLNRIGRVSRGLSEPRAAMRSILDAAAHSNVGSATLAALRDGRESLASATEPWESAPSPAPEPCASPPHATPSGQPPADSAGAAGGTTASAGVSSGRLGVPLGVSAERLSPSSLGNTLGALCLGASSASATQCLAGLQAQGLQAQRSFLRALGAADGEADLVGVYEESSAASTESSTLSSAHAHRAQPPGGGGLRDGRRGAAAFPTTAPTVDLDEAEAMIDVLEHLLLRSATVLALHLGGRSHLLSADGRQRSSTPSVLAGMGRARAASEGASPEPSLATGTSPSPGVCGLRSSPSAALVQHAAGTLAELSGKVAGAVHRRTGSGDQRLTSRAAADGRVDSRGHRRQSSGDGLAPALSELRDALKRLPLLRLPSSVDSLLTRASPVPIEELELVDEIGGDCEALGRQMRRAIDACLAPGGGARVTAAGRRCTDASPEHRPSAAPMLADDEDEEWGQLLLPRRMSSYEREARAPAGTDALDGSPGGGGELPAFGTPLTRSVPPRALPDATATGDVNADAMANVGVAGATGGGAGAYALSPPPSAHALAPHPLSEAHLGSSSDECSRLTAALSLADAVRTLEEEQRTELDRLIRTYERCRRVCEHQRLRRRLLQLLRHRQGAVRDSDGAREALGEVVGLMAREREDTPAHLQMCAAALLAHLSEAPDGARRLLQCGAGPPAVALWHEGLDYADGGAAPSCREAGKPPAAQLSATHARHTSLFASELLANLVVHAAHSRERKRLVAAGVVPPLLALAAAVRPEHSRSAADGGARPAGEHPEGDVREGANGSLVDELGWRASLRPHAANALLALTLRPSARTGLVQAGALWRWLELCASSEPGVVAVAAEALRNVSESEELVRPRAACGDSKPPLACGFPRPHPNRPPV